MNKRVTSMPNADYQSADGISHTGLMMVSRNPSDLVWAKNAPVDASKSATKDIGTALHSALLEPEKFEDDVFISSVKGRTTKKFADEVAENPGKTVLTEEEAEKIRIMVASANAHPTFKAMVSAQGYNECSIFAQDEKRDILLKCRPDRDCISKHGLIFDVKTTDSLDDWRNPKQWINPLFKFNYGLQACHYLNTASIFYGKDVKEFTFLVLQKSVQFGRYPVAVFTITEDELGALGFWDAYNANLDKYAECYHANKWTGVERFAIDI